MNSLNGQEKPRFLIAVVVGWHFGDLVEVAFWWGVVAN